MVQARDLYVSPSGSANGDGSINSPWTFARALTIVQNANNAQPGDTIWVREGVYNVMMRVELSGSSSAPIIIRNYNNERAIIDTNTTLPNGRRVSSALTIVGSDLWFWGLEFTNSDTKRIFTAAEYQSCFPFCRAGAMDIFGHRIKVINNIIHDTGNGIGAWGVAADTEIYGNIIYNYGWEDSIGGKGHALYLQNNTGFKNVRNNIAFNGFSAGVHAYGGSDALLLNMTFDGNTIFNPGSIAKDPNGFAFLVGGTNRADNITFTNNAHYSDLSLRRNLGFNPSYRAGTQHLIMNNNFSVGVSPIMVPPTVGVLQSTNNSFYGQGLGLQDYAYTRTLFGDPSNIFGDPQPSLTRVLVRPNTYEPNKIYIAVYNGALSPTVSLRVEGLLSGERYSIKNVTDLFNSTSVLSGTYNGSSIELPMIPTSTVVQPVGITPRVPLETLPRFGVFVLTKQPGITVVSSPSVSPPSVALPTRSDVMIFMGAAAKTIKYTLTNPESKELERVAMKSIQTPLTSSERTFFLSMLNRTLNSVGLTDQERAAIQRTIATITSASN